MTIENNYSITQLFATKNITITIDRKQSFELRVPVIRDLFEDTRWNNLFFLWTRPMKEAQKYYYKPVHNALELVTLILFDASQYRELVELSRQYKYYLEKWIPDIEIDYKNQVLKVKDIIITEEIWEHILYLLKLSCGEKVVQPPTFASEEARKLFLAQQENEERLQRLKAQRSSDKESLIKALLTITYVFPSMTIDYLFNQTMAQIQWLQTNAAGAVSYEVNAQAFAAGNMKKGKKLDFFIK